MNILMKIKLLFFSSFYAVLFMCSFVLRSLFILKTYIGQRSFNRLPMARAPSCGQSR